MKRLQGRSGISLRRTELGAARERGGDQSSALSWVLGSTLTSGGPAKLRPKQSRDLAPRMTVCVAEMILLAAKGDCAAASSRSGRAIVGAAISGEAARNESSPCSAGGRGVTKLCIGSAIGRSGKSAMSIGFKLWGVPEGHVAVPPP